MFTIDPDVWDDDSDVDVDAYTEAERCEADRLLDDSTAVCLRRLDQDGTCPGAGSHVPPFPVGRLHVVCDRCGRLHEADYSHLGRWEQGRIFVVYCDDLADYYTQEVVISER